MAIEDLNNFTQGTIDNAHKLSKKLAPSIMQRGRNLSYSMGTSLCRAVQLLQHNNQRVKFDSGNRVARIYSDDVVAMVTYDSGVNGHCISEADRIWAKLPILRQSSKHVRLANDGISAGKYVTKLPFQQLSKNAAQTDTFQELPTSLMSVGKTCDNGNIFIFTRDVITLHKEQDVQITCKGASILIGVRDK